LDAGVVNGTLHLGDCLDVLPTIADGSVDLVLADPPYGTTQNHWDSVIPLAPLWCQLLRVCRGPVVLTAAQPFASSLVASAPGLFRYDLIWRKNKASGFLNAKRQPLRQHEHILVFSRKAPPYFPQKSTGHEARTGWKRRKGSSNYGEQRDNFYTPDETRYPVSVLDFAVVNNDSPERIHPTQKPVELFEYLVRTYTAEGQTVLDFCAGSGTTAIAAARTGRRWIAIESDPNIHAAAEARIGGDLLDRAA
jgi:site-specific DNA-methyltransferase (adenine-specific)